MKALRVLDTSRWPVYKQQYTAELDAYGNDDISLLVENYRVFFEDTLTGGYRVHTSLKTQHRR